MTFLRRCDLETVKSKCSCRQELNKFLQISLEDGTVAELRDEYTLELWKAMGGTEQREDAHWLRCTSERVFFVTKNGCHLHVTEKTMREEQTKEEQTKEEQTKEEQTKEEQLDDKCEHVHIVLDQSSSMREMQSSVYHAAAELVSDVPATTRLTFTTFATNVTLGTTMGKQEMMQTLASKREANGCTALYDAIVRVLNSCNSDKGRVTVIVITDGQDTASTQNTKANVRDLIRMFKTNQKNRIVFLGADQDAIMSAGGLGIASEYALSFSRGDGNVRAAFRAASEVMARNRSGIHDGFRCSDRSQSMMRHLNA
jgi:Mg-chelatase subunit ChlD